MTLEKIHLMTAVNSFNQLVSSYWILSINRVAEVVYLTVIDTSDLDYLKQDKVPNRDF